MCADLDLSVNLVRENCSLFNREWAYLHRSLSGKYRVSRITVTTTEFDELKSIRTGTYPDGVYIYLGKRIRVDLIEADPDLSDFYVVNGNFDGTHYELLSYHTGNKIEGDGSRYLIPASELPPSETPGIGVLDVQGRTFGNIPPLQRGYIHRPVLEAELHTHLTNDRHSIVTLVGRGGIGKTSLALSVLNHIANQGLYAAIVWFSARDIDLLPEGPRQVNPHVVTEKDVAREFVRLMQPKQRSAKGFDATGYFASALTTSPLGAPILFVFDNFETVRSPAELYSWIETYVRLPNKILITTRARDFKADYPVEVPGMTEREADALMDSAAAGLGITALLTDEYRRDVFRESDGHPYVIKVLLGEVAKAGRLVKVERIVAGKDEILEALFERTYTLVSPAAKRVFLTLCNWRSTMPQLAVEAVLLWSANEKMDVESAIEELRKSSFIEISTSEHDNAPFLTVPLVASVFGRRKLAVSPIKSVIEADTSVLRSLGAAQQSDIRHGVAPRIHRLFRYIAERVSLGDSTVTEYLPMLEFIARRYPQAWLLLAPLYEEAGVRMVLSRPKPQLDAFSRPLTRT